jgi:hypothetical protein
MFTLYVYALAYYILLFLFFTVYGQILNKILQLNVFKIALQ